MGIFARHGNRLTETRLWPSGESMGLIERSHEVTFSGVAGTLHPFVTKEEGRTGARRLQLATGPPDCGEGSWSPGEVKKGKTRVPSANRNILLDQGSCKGSCVHINATEMYR